eukprot:g7837.t1
MSVEDMPLAASVEVRGRCYVLLSFCVRSGRWWPHIRLVMSTENPHQLSDRRILEQKKAESTIRSTEVVEHAGRSLNVHDLVTDLMRTLGERSSWYSSENSVAAPSSDSSHCSSKTSLIAFPDGTNSRTFETARSRSCRVTPSVKIAKSASGKVADKAFVEYKVDPTTLVLSLTFWQCASAEEQRQGQVKADAERKKRTEQVTAAITSNEKAMAKATESGDLSDVGALYLERKRLDEELRQLQTTERQSIPVKEYGAQFNIQPFSSFCGVVWNPYFAPTLTRFKS